MNIFFHNGINLDKVRIRVIVCLFFLSIPASNLSAQQEAGEIKEIFKKSSITNQLVSPGYAKEILWFSTVFRNRLYVGTYPNAHIYKINPYSNPPIIEKDLGSVSYPGETNEPGEPGSYDMKIIQAIISDSNYIYGAVSLVPHLFYHNPNTEKTHSFGLNVLKAAFVKGIYDPVFYSDQMGNKYIYFGTIVDQTNNMKIIKWRIKSANAPENSLPEKYFEIIEFNKPFPIANSIEFGKYNGRDVIYIGASNGTEDAIFIYNINGNPNDVIQVNLSELNSALKLSVINFKSDLKENHLWLFDYKIREANIFQKKITRVISSSDSVAFKAYNVQQNYPIYNNLMYTSLGYANLISNTFHSYSNNTVFVSRDRNLIDNSIVGANSWANDPKIFTSLNLNNYSVANSVLTEPSSIINPTGGGLISGLAVANRKIFSSVYFTEVELIAEVSDLFWRISDINGPNPGAGKKATQSNKMIIDKNNNMVLYGLYNGPFLRRRALSTSYDQFHDLSYLNPDNDQGRITGMVLTDDNHLLMGTSPVSYASNPPKYIYYDLSNSKSPKVIAKSDGGGFTTSLSYLAINNKHRFFGTIDDKWAFVFEVEKNLLDTITSPLIIPTYSNPSGYFSPTSLLAAKNGQKIVLADCHHLWIYNASKLKTKNDFSLSGNAEAVFYKAFFHLYCGEGTFDAKGYVQQFIEGNDGLIYGYFGGTLFHFDAFAANPRTTLVKYKIPGYNEHTPALEISNLAVDEIATNNKTIYIGTRSGKLFEFKRETSDSGNETNLPTSISLNNNYPNPFNPSTVIEYSLSHSTFVQLNIYDVLGKKLITLVDEYQKAAEYKVNFDYRSYDNLNLSSGVYFYQLKTPDKVITKKMLLLR